MCAHSDNVNDLRCLPAWAEIRSATDQFMGNLPGVTRETIPCETGEALMIQEITLDPGASIPLHYHLNRRETYWPLSGRGVLIMNGQEYELSQAGLSRVFIRREVVHGLRNDSSEPFKFKVMYNALGGTVSGDTYLD